MQTEERPGHQVLAGFLSQVIYVALLLLLIGGAVFYGGSDPWWKAFLSAGIFAAGVLACFERLLSRDRHFAGLDLFLPVLALIAFSLLQTISLGHADGSAYGIKFPFWNSISADPYETRIFALELTSLVLLAAMLLRYGTTERRLRGLVFTIIALALGSALFGMLRQTMQHTPGFLGPVLQPQIGYGQFVNKNHFAYLMEMGFGLAFGLVAGGGVRRERMLVYAGAVLPIWTALVLSNSRGGILGMLVQLLMTVLLFPSVVSARALERAPAGRLLRSTFTRVVLISGLIAVVGVGVIWVGGDRLVTSIEDARTEFEAGPSREGVTRLRIWDATLQMIEAHPVAGIGLGGYWSAFPTYHDAPGTILAYQAHNDYLELVASAGIVGLAIGAWFVVVLYKGIRAGLNSWDRYRRATCFAALIGITGIAVHSIFDFGLHRMLNAMVFTALIVIATYNPGDPGNRLTTRV